MAQNSPHKVAPFEHYMFADDRADAPMTFFLRFQIAGRIDLPMFEAAVWQAQLRNVLTRCVITGERGAITEKLAWREADQPRCHIGASLPGTPFPQYPAAGASIDLSREVGLRFFVQHRYAEGHVLLMQVHHSVCDAIGATQMMDDLLTAYDALSLNKESPQFRHLGESLLEKRFEIAADAKGHGMGDLARFIRTLANPAEPIGQDACTNDASELGACSFPSSRSAYLSIKQREDLAGAAASAGGTINDALLTRLLLALDRCYGQDGRIDTARIGIPVNLRGGALADMPAANAVGMAFLNWKLTDTRNNVRLLEQVADRTRDIKANAEAAVFCEALALAGRFPGGLDKFTSPHLCFCTAVLSNLVRPFANSRLLGDDGLIRAGDLSVVSCELLPPVRPLTSAAFGVVTYGERTQITLHYDVRVISHDEADLLLREFAGVEPQASLAINL